MIQFLLNDRVIQTEAQTGERLLDFIRLSQNLKGTKEGCREGDCGACLVLVGEVNSGLKYKTANSCLLPLGEIEGKHIVTIEGINNDGLNLIQQLIVDEHASQCGFCTPGIIISMLGYLLNAKQLTKHDALTYLDGNICRCTGYGAVKRASDLMVEKLSNTDLPAAGEARIQYFIELGILPMYFQNVEYLLSGFDVIEPDVDIFDTNRFRVAGSTDIYVQHEDEMDDAAVTFLNRHEDWNKISIEEDYLQIGGLTTVEDIFRSELLNQYIPEIGRKFPLVSSTPIRNKATLAGNLVNASPIGDLTIFFMALGAEIKLVSDQTERILPLKEFYLDYKKLNKSEAELIEWVRIPVPKDGYKFNFEKISKRTHLDIASVNSAMFLETDNDSIKTLHLSAGGIGPIPLYFDETAKFAAGKEINTKNIQEIIQKALTEISPIDDVRGSAEYKSLQLRQLIYAHFNEFFPQLLKKGDIR